MRIVDYDDLIITSSVEELYAELFGFNRKSVKNAIEDGNIEFKQVWFIEDYLTLDNIFLFIKSAVEYDLISYMEPPEDITVRIGEKYVTISFKVGSEASKLTMSTLTYMSDRIVISQSQKKNILVDNDKVEILLLNAQFNLDVDKNLEDKLPMFTYVTGSKFNSTLKFRDNALIEFKQDTIITADIPIEAEGTVTISGSRHKLELVCLNRTQPCIGVRNYGSSKGNSLKKLVLRSVDVICDCYGNFKIGSYDSDIETEIVFENATLNKNGTKERTTAAAYLDSLKEEIT